MPRFSEDDVVNFMVLEALQHRGVRDQKKAEYAQEAEAFKKSHKKFDPNAPNGG